MTIFKDFSEEGKHLSTRDVSVTEENLKRYIEEYGIERAMGYLDAINDMNNELYEVFKNRQYSGSAFAGSHKVKTNLKNFHAHKIEFATFMQSELDQHADKKPSNSDLNATYKIE